MSAAIDYKSVIIGNSSCETPDPQGSDLGRANSLQNTPEISSKMVFGHGGPRANSGGPRENSGGSRPGAGRPRKLVIVEPAIQDPQCCVYAVWGQAERVVAQELTRQGYRTYLPLVAIRRRDPVIPTKFNIVRVPFIPGYGFVWLTPTESREPILMTRGVREILLRPDGRPAYVRGEEIARLLLNEEKRLQLPKEHGPILAVGAAVRVLEGPFTNHSGKVVECDGVKTKADVHIFGALRPVWFDRVDLVEVTA